MKNKIIVFWLCFSGVVHATFDENINAGINEIADACRMTSIILCTKASTAQPDQEIQAWIVQGFKKDGRRCGKGLNRCYYTCFGKKYSDQLPEKISRNCGSLGKLVAWSAMQYRKLFGLKYKEKKD